MLVASFFSLFLFYLIFPLGKKKKKNTQWRTFTVVINNVNEYIPY